MLVLGIGGFMHDYNCCLVDLNKKRIAMCEAERLSRRKHHVILAGDDLLAPVRKCCVDMGCRIKDIDAIVFAHTDPFDCKELLKKELRRKEYFEVDHHLCHAAAAFFSSPFESALIVSLDGFGDGSSGLMAVGNRNRIEEFERIGEEDSIGLEYLRVTVHLGIGGYGAEGKTQGLASYGEPTLFEEYMNEIEITSQGNLRLSARLQSEGSRLSEEGGYLNTQLLNNAMLSDYCPRRISPEPITEIHMNLAASIQRVLEHVVLELCGIGKSRTDQGNLVLSGGVAMNSSLNGLLLQSGQFRSIFPIPMASDRGSGLGAALYHVHQNLDIPRFFLLDHVFFGNTFNEKEAVRAMKKGGLSYSKGDDVAEIVAQSLSRGEIVGWFQERSEVGARALGHRSILADPRPAEMKDRVNARVKHREWFRPFAPSCLVEDAHDYFSIPDSGIDFSYMTFTVPANGHAAQTIPAVIHVDKTARIQTVDARKDALYARIIRRFEELTDVPVVLNTSFNDKGDPIVETPQDAVETFLKTDMDVLCIGNIIGRKK